jgi:phosphoglycerol transferase MdoB-like AlkP superfamily enzyme
MIQYIILFNSFIFITLAIIHFYWAFGGKIGIDEALPTTVNGVKLFNPGKFLTIVVGIVLLFFAYIVLKIESSIFILAILFAIRVVGDFHYVGFFKKIKSTPFAIYDTKYFSPLCLYLALSLTFIVYNR